ncbi:hypothetical protein QBC47DRAFT_464276 [Echria macrotheca]|uniref:NAD(P)-binding protein n=1 Tax=Echria macrotheca TaxID=438768 RepID=A0AAJ0B3U5_9PEZI|nr:hypothetical protein QBC47DRAFT_464276 [Echria macrotheca]
MAMDTFKTILAGLGALVLLRFARSTFHFFALHFWRPSHPLTRYKRANSDAYALITGSSAGIGLGIARALVRQGFGVILLGHLPDELASASESLVAEHPAANGRVRTLVVNGQTATHEQIQQAVASVSDLPITILVNNVGSATLAVPPIRPLSTLSLSQIDAHVDLNARFMARLTSLVLPILTSSKKSKDDRALILNLSSVGKMGLPFLVMYGATKAFDYAFSTGLARELEGDEETAHVDCLAIVPGEVRTQTNAAASPSRAPTADEFGRAIVDKVDGALARGRRELRPDWRHDLTVAMMDNVFSEGFLSWSVRQDLLDKKAKTEGKKDA